MRTATFWLSTSQRIWSSIRLPGITATPSSTPYCITVGGTARHQRRAAPPGIVHRIDKDTTGSVIVCKNDAAHQALAVQFADHTITRRYRAIVHGVLTDDEGIIDAPIGRDNADRKKMAVNQVNGKRAVTIILS